MGALSASKNSSISFLQDYPRCSKPNQMHERASRLPYPVEEPN